MSCLNTPSALLSQFILIAVHPIVKTSDLNLHKALASFAVLVPPIPLFIPFALIHLNIQQQKIMCAIQPMTATTRRLTDIAWTGIICRL